MKFSEFKIVRNGFDPLLLGMSRSEAVSVIGMRPTSDQPCLRGEHALRFYPPYVRIVFRDDCSVELSLVPPNKVVFKGRSLFEDNSVWQELVALDGDARETLGFIVLRNLCLTLTGFHDGDHSQLAVTAFEHGRWDQFEGEMVPFSL